MLNRCGNILWNNQDSTAATKIYMELTRRNWSVSDFHIEEDETEWLKVDFNRRSDIIKGFLVSNAIKQAFGSILLPILNTSIDLEDITKRAIISRIESILNGEHSQLNSKIIRELNSKHLVQKIAKDIKEGDQLVDVFQKIETTFEGMFGWKSAYEAGLQMEGKDLFQQLHLHIWKASSLATVLLEAAESLSLTSLFLALEAGAELPEMLLAVQTMTKDTAIISTYLSILAEESFRLLTKENQEQNKKWLMKTINDYFKAPWNNSLAKSDLNEETKEISSQFVEYNLNKSLVKLEFYPKEKVEQMPKLIEKYLGVDIDYWISKGQENPYKEEKEKGKWWE